MTVEISLAAVKNASDAIIGFVAIGRDVTIRTEYEEGMREQIYFLQQLIDRIPNPVFFKDKNGIYLGCNMAFEEFLGMEKHEIIGKTVYDIAPEEKAEKYYEMDNKLFQKGGYQVYEYSVEDANGNIHEVIFHKASFSNLNGDIAGLVGVINDITDYKTLESNFHETEKLFQFLFDNFDTPLYLFEMKGNRFELHEVNYNACQALGYDKNELLQLSPKDIFQKFIQGKSKDKLLADKRVEVSTKRIDKTGKKVPIKLVAVLIEHKDLNTVLAIEEKS
jgi:PAS domain S-box-containing protein